MKPHVAVLGAGLQGSCVALELAARGCKVDVFDRNDACVTQASAHNEGKIHLGFVYANDPTRRTARTMVRGALTFAPLMRRWLGGGAVDRVPRTEPFLYAVHAASLVPVDAVRRHFDNCVAIASEYPNAPEYDYFGRDFRQPVRQLTRLELEATFDPRKVAASIRTHEIGVDPEAMAALIRERIATVDEISLHLNTVVESVALDGRKPSVVFEHQGARSRQGYDHVVNALWDGRLKIDATTGEVPDRPWLWRIRRNVRAEIPQSAGDLPSVTVIVGPFGDIAHFGKGKAFLSWYRYGRVGVSRDIAPAVWQRPDDLPSSPSTEDGILAGLGEVVPAVGKLAAHLDGRMRLTEGVIFAWGATDISDRASGLHQRYDIGVRSRGRYHSIDTGKYTLAPLFATEVVARILEMT